VRSRSRSKSAARASRHYHARAGRHRYHRPAYRREGLRDRSTDTRRIPIRDPAFDWDDESTWAPALRGVQAAYLTYPTDLGLPEAAGRVDWFATAAVEHGARRLVLLSGCG